MVLRFCHEWLEHPYITQPRFSNGDKCAARWTLKMARYTTHAQRSRGKCIIPLPCCDTHIFHSGFMRVLNPERDQMKRQRQTSTTGFSKSFSRLNAICIDFRKHNCFVLQRNLLKYYISFFDLPTRYILLNCLGIQGDC